MTISTIIPYRAGKQYAPADGPTNCTRCARFLLDRTSDKVEDSWDGPTELTVHIWEHDVDSEGRALCGSCAEVDDQTEAWRQLVAWCHRSDVRQLHVRCSGVWLEENREHVRMFVAISGRLPVPDVLAFVGRDPLRPGASSRPGKMEPDGVSWKTFYTQAAHQIVATVEALGGIDAVMLDSAIDADQAAQDDECPETERNTKR